VEAVSEAVVPGGVDVGASFIVRLRKKGWFLCIRLILI